MQNVLCNNNNKKKLFIIKQREFNVKQNKTKSKQECNIKRHLGDHIHVILMLFLHVVCVCVFYFILFQEN